MQVRASALVQRPAPVCLSLCPRQAYRDEKEVPGTVTTVVYEEAVHVCNNVQYKARPMIADWLAKQLASAA